jgi:phage tail sheath gpL-like
MTVATNTYTLHPQDGWVEIAATSVANFLRINHFPAHVPIFIAVGSSAPQVDTQATGTVTFSTANPTATHVVTIGSETYEFVTSGATGNQVNLGGTYLLTATAFTAKVNANSNLVTAVDSSGTVTLTAKTGGSTGGTGGNTITLTTNDSNIAVSGATLSGGANQVAAGGFRIDECSEHFIGAFTGNVYARIQSNANDKVIVFVWQN